MNDSGAERNRLIAVCGKGGVGKTVFTALAARVLLESGKAGKLLLIDADPAMGLPSALGVEVSRTMGQVREEIIETARNATEEDKLQLADRIDYLTLQALTEKEAFSLLAMGRTEARGCYCPVNTLLRGAIELLSVSFDTILIDGEAGLEQLQRQVMQGVDLLILVSDPSTRGLRTVAAISEMVHKDAALRCRRVGVVFNRIQDSPEELIAWAERAGLEVLGWIPQDENISRHDFSGKPLTELPAATPALAAVQRIFETRVLS